MSCLILSDAPDLGVQTRWIDLPDTSPGSPAAASGHVEGVPLALSLRGRDLSLHGLSTASPRAGREPQASELACHPANSDALFIPGAA